MLSVRIITAFLALATLGLPRGSDALAHATARGTASGFVLAHVHTDHGLGVGHEHEVTEQSNSTGDAPTVALSQLRIDHDRDALYLTASCIAPLPATPSVDHASRFVAAATFWGEMIVRDLAVSRVSRTESMPSTSVRSRSSILLQTSILLI